MIAIGCDHGGFDLKEKITVYLRNDGIEYRDFGTYTMDSVDYPYYADKVANAILSGECEKGILLCSNGIGISIAANRHKGIRAAICHDVHTAWLTRQHNNSNVIVMGGQVIGEGYALKILKTFLDTEFSGEERHSRRVELIDELS